MQDPNEDTEWNDILRAKGIIPPRVEEPAITEEQIQQMVDQTIAKRADIEQKKKVEDMNLDELDELEDSEDEEVLEQYRLRRMAEMRAFAQKAIFGTVREISGQDYVDEVTKAGAGIQVVLHLYANGVPQCALVHNHMQQLARRHPQTKFLRSVASTCIPNYPEKNLPTIFVYYEGQLKRQFVGPIELRGDKLTVQELEYMLGQAGAIETEIKEDPKQQIRDKMLADLESANIDFE